jgi:hypothetical protein
MSLPILLAAHTEVQAAEFLRHYNIPRDRVCRVRGEYDIVGRHTCRPLVCLPGWRRIPTLDRALHTWRRRGGEIIELTEAEARAVDRSCPWDTDGDGDCPRCAGQGFCYWKAEVIAGDDHS